MTWIQRCLAWLKANPFAKRGRVRRGNRGGGEVSKPKQLYTIENAKTNRGGRSG